MSRTRNFVLNRRGSSHSGLAILHLKMMFLIKRIESAGLSDVEGKLLTFQSRSLPLSFRPYVEGAKIRSFVLFKRGVLYIKNEEFCIKNDESVVASYEEQNEAFAVVLRFVFIVHL